MELKTVLCAHAARYPKLQAPDAVKLIYQNEFGGGHLIRDEGAFRAYLQREYAATEKNPKAEKFESLGNGILRVQLCALQEEALEPLTLAFLRSAREHRGNMDSFLEKLKLLRELTGEGIFSFDPRTLEDYLKGYAAAGYPMVSHSQIYRKAYRPAYRIITEANRSLLQETSPLSER